MQGISTFMAEMLDTAHLLRGAGPRSLVIIDELGRGTSTADGFGVAWAVSRHLARDTRCFTLFATHFHELTDLSKEMDGSSIVNVYVDAHTTASSITMKYEVRPGICDHSFGLHVATLANFPAAIVRNAKALILEEERQEEEEDAIVMGRSKGKGQGQGQLDSTITGEIGRYRGIAEMQAFLDAFVSLPICLSGENSKNALFAKVQMLQQRVKSSAATNTFLDQNLLA